MWKVPLLLLVLGRASLWFLAEGGKTRRPRLPTAAGGGEGALTCWNAWVWHLRLTGKAEGSSGVCAQESGGPRRKGSGPAGARSHRKSCAGCQKEPLNPQRCVEQRGPSSWRAHLWPSPAQLTRDRVTGNSKEPSTGRAGRSCRAVPEASPWPRKELGPWNWEVQECQGGGRAPRGEPWSPSEDCRV